MDSLGPYLAAIIPTLVVAAFFYAIMKRIIEGDRRERLAQKRFDAQEEVRSMQQRPSTDSEQGTPPEDS